VRAGALVRLPPGHAGPVSRPHPAPVPDRHIEEARLVRDLRRIGATVLDVDPETGRQWRVEAQVGHFAGSLDAVALGLLEAPAVWHLVEFKTHNAKSFATLKRDGVRKSKPLHWAQMQTYLHLAGLDRAIYVAICKVTDEIHIERVAADHDEGERLLAKAKRIIEAPRPPAGISTDRESWHCKFCDHHRLCHEQGAAEVSCRTCLHATPIEGGWRCERWSHALTPAEQRAGCDRHLYVPDLVPGAMLEVGDDWVEYRMRDGSTWRNGGRGATP
jgi:hypothetical protein